MFERHRIARTALSGLVATLLVGLVGLVGFGAPAHAKPVVGDDPLDRAAVQIVEFTDIECPFCARAMPTLDDLEALYGELLVIRTMHQPLPFHTRAEAAARAIEAAGRQGKFREMKRLLFERRKQLSDDELVAHAKELGLDVPRFVEDLADPAIDKLVQRHKKIALNLEVRGVPAFFINGQRLNGAQPRAKFEALIDAELAARPDEMAVGAAWIEKRTKRNHAVLHGLLFTSVEPVPPEAPAPDAPTAPATRPPVEATIYRAPVDPARDGIIGPTHAPLTAVVVLGYQCSFSKKHEATLDGLRALYGDALRVVVKHNPLDFHKNGSLLASLAICARKSGQAAFGAMHKALMAIERPGDVTRGSLLDLAVELGEDRAAMDACLDAKSTAKHLAADLELAAEIARGTPFTFINGRKMAGAKPLDEFIALADEELAAANLRLEKKTPLAQLYDAIIAEGSSANP